MSITSASGHLQNLTSLEGLRAFCLTLGTVYNPSNELLSVANMQQLITQGHEIHLQLVTANAVLTTYVAERKTYFNEFDSMMPQIRNLFQVYCKDENLNIQFDAIYRKLVGQRASKIEENPDNSTPDPNQPEIKHISALQTGFDDKLANFEKLLVLLNQIDDYQPNEEKFTYFGLKNYLGTIKAIHQQVNQAIGPMIEARNRRNYFFYNPETGIVEIGRTVKKYLRAVMKPNNILYKDVSRFVFKNYQRGVMIEIPEPGGAEPQS